MQANAYSPYALKDLHQAIDLMDRKITYCTTLEAFETQEGRDACLRKLSTKRAALVKTALALAALGVRCDPKFLPRSFIRLVEDEASAVPAGPVVDEGAKTTKLPRPRGKRS
jgi:hypothetical protein